MGKNGSREKEEIVYERPYLEGTGRLENNADSKQRYAHTGWLGKVKMFISHRGLRKSFDLCDVVVVFKRSENLRSSDAIYTWKDLKSKCI